MKVTEKDNGQVFERYTSRKEFAEMVRTLTWNDGVWSDDDSSLTMTYKDGTTESYFLGDKKKPLKLDQVVKGYFNNPGTMAVYNCNIVYNSHYEDWEVEDYE